MCTTCTFERDPCRCSGLSCNEESSAISIHARRTLNPPGSRRNHSFDGCRFGGKVRSMHSWQEAERSEGAARSVKPVTNAPTVRRQFAPDREPVVGDCPSVRTAVGDDYPNSDACRRQPTPGGDVRCQATLSIKGSEHLVEVDKLGLELDDEEGTCGRVPREDVDGSALAPDREGNLRLRDPGRVQREESSHHLVHGRVSPVDQSTEVASLPTDVHLDSSIQCGSDLPHLGNGDAADATAFDARHEPAGNAGPCREIALSPSLLCADRAKCPSDPLIIHTTILATSAQPAITSLAV